MWLFALQKNGAPCKWHFELRGGFFCSLQDFLMYWASASWNFSSVPRYINLWHNFYCSFCCGVQSLFLLWVFQLLERKFPCIFGRTKSCSVSHLFCFLKFHLWYRGFQTIIFFMRLYFFIYTSKLVNNKKKGKSKISFSCITMIKLTIWFGLIHICKESLWLCWLGLV